MTPSTKPRKLRIVCISDTHNHRPGEGYTLPKGDVLIHAGDLTNQGTYGELKKAVEWIEKREDFGVKIVVAGNHDLSLDPQYTLKYATGWRVKPAEDQLLASRALISTNPHITYLQHSSSEITIQNTTTLRIFGSPYSPDRGGQNWAFQYSSSSSPDLWNAIPAETDVLVTHTPPAGHCDTSRHWTSGGCEALAETLARVRPVLHICGHCHEGRGVRILRWGERGGGGVEGVRGWEDPGLGNKRLSVLDLSGVERGRETVVVNASVMARSWGRGGGKGFNKAVVVDLEV